VQLTKKERPKILDSITEQVTTGCGHLYVTIGFDKETGSPMEVFAALGKAGGCSNCFNESLTRAISVGLKYGVPLEEYVDELKGHQCPSSNLWPEAERILSCPDGMAKVLNGHVK